MLQRLSLKLKICSGFLLVALMTLIVGLVGWQGAANLHQEVNYTTQINFPMLQYLITIKENIQEILIAQRTLLNSDLSSPDRQKQYEIVKQARAAYAKASDALEKLPKNPEEINLWEQLKQAIADWRQKDDEFFRMSHEIERLGIINPLVVAQEKIFR